MYILNESLIAWLIIMFTMNCGLQVENVVNNVNWMNCGFVWWWEYWLYVKLWIDELMVGMWKVCFVSNWIEMWIKNMKVDEIEIMLTLRYWDWVLNGDMKVVGIAIVIAIEIEIVVGKIEMIIWLWIGSWWFMFDYWLCDCWLTFFGLVMSLISKCVVRFGNPKVEMNEMYAYNVKWSLKRDD